MNPPPSPALPACARRLPWPIWGVIIALLLAPWPVVWPLLRGNRAAIESNQAWNTVRQFGVTRAPAAPARRLPAGPWGEIEAREIIVGMPEEFVWAELPADFRPRWLFTGFTRERLAEFLRAMPLSDEQRHDLLRPSQWSEEANGVLVLPKVETVLTLTTNTRARIYAQLVDSWDEQSQRFAVPFEPGEMERLLATGRLAPATREMVLRLLYPRGDSLMFGDMRTALAALPTQEERHELVRTLARHRTYLLRLRVGPKSDVDALVAYWRGTTGRSKDLRPILASLARSPGGGVIDVTHLLPPMPRRQLYTYPHVSFDPVEERRDCHWTSANFFNETPDDQFTDAASAARYFYEQCQRVNDAPRFGDVIILFDHHETAVHSAVHVAADMVFCKNGGHYANPWMLQTREEMLRYYNALYSADGGIEERIYRRRTDAAAP
jgi:hypothetical protein